MKDAVFKHLADEEVPDDEVCSTFNIRLALSC